MHSRLSPHSWGWRLLCPLASGLLIALVVLLVLFAFRVGQAQAVGVKLEWDYVQGPSPADGFIVLRCAGAGCTNFVPLTTTPLPITTLTYTDTTVQGGTTYRWTVQAKGATGVSAPATPVAFSVPLPLPMAPSNLRATVVQ